MTKKELVNRIRRIEEQLGGIQRMVEEDTYCVDVLLQVAAVRGALDKVGEKLLSAHINSCVWAAFQEGNHEDRERRSVNSHDFLTLCKTRRSLRARLPSSHEDFAIAGWRSRQRYASFAEHDRLSTPGCFYASDFRAWVLGR